MLKKTVAPSSATVQPDGLVASATVVFFNVFDFTTVAAPAKHSAAEVRDEL